VQHRLDAAVEIWSQNVKAPLEEAGFVLTLEAFDTRLPWLQNGPEEMRGKPGVLSLASACMKALEEDCLCCSDDETNSTLTLLLTAWQVAAQDIWQVSRSSRSCVLLSHRRKGKYKKYVTLPLQKRNNSMFDSIKVYALQF
jgi:hypothetical protein